MSKTCILKYTIIIIMSEMIRHFFNYLFRTLNSPGRKSVTVTKETVILYS